VLVREKSVACRIYLAYTLPESYGRWIVYYSEKGLQSNKKEFATESQACQYLLHHPTVPIHCFLPLNAEAKNLRIDHAKPLAVPRPPQTTAASSKSPYRKRPAGTPPDFTPMFGVGVVVDRVLKIFSLSISGMSVS
jgi:hypothetical protein